MTNTYNHAKRELEILTKSHPHPDPENRPIIEDFIPEILALCEKFGNSGQSGGSAPYVATVLSHAIKTLCLQEPICPLTGIDEEWNDVSEISDEKIGTIFQNNRDRAVFKDNSGAYYLDAIVFKGEDGNCFTLNSVDLQETAKTKNGNSISSMQYIKDFPFLPKTFYIDVIQTEWADKEETIKQQGGGWWTAVVKNEKQLEKVWKYYKKPKNL